MFKDFTTALYLSIFLDVESSADFQAIRSLTTTHWHGMFYDVVVNIFLLLVVVFLSFKSCTGNILIIIISYKM